MNLHLKTTLIAATLIASLSQHAMATSKFDGLDNLSQAQVAQLSAFERQARHRNMPTALDDRALKNILTAEQLQQVEQNKAQNRANNTLTLRPIPKNGRDYAVDNLSAEQVRQLAALEQTGNSKDDPNVIREAQQRQVLSTEQYQQALQAAQQNQTTSHLSVAGTINYNRR